MKVLIDGQTLATPEIDRGIGRFFREVCGRLVPRDLATEWLITVEDEKLLECFSLETRKRLKPVEVNIASVAKASIAEKTKYYSQQLEEIVLAKGIDAYWNPNPLMLNVILPIGLSSLPVILTVHDLIPLQFPKEYLSKWPKMTRAEYLKRLAAIGSWATFLVFVSRHSMESFTDRYPGSSATCSVVHHGVNRRLFWPGFTRQVNSERILFVGGFDYRKNMENAVKAFSVFSRFPEFVDSKLQLFLVCSAVEQERAQVMELAEHLGVAEQVVLTGWLDDSELAELFRQSSLFFFPSRYEGFGLPLLEAMATGLPVVTSRVSSLPEVGGDLPYYCSPEDPQDMARALGKALSDIRADRVDTEVLTSWASRFTWDGTAACYSRIFDKATQKRQAPEKKVRVAWVSPWPPQRSGIADYSFHLVPEIGRHCEVTIFVDGDVSDFSRLEGVQLENLTQLESQREEFDQVIYHIGNNVEFHKKIYLAAVSNPGIVVLHDFNLHPFLKDAFLGTPEEATYEAALVNGYGDSGEAHFREIKDGGVECDIWGFPMSHHLARLSSAVIVHSNWVKAQLPDLQRVLVVPLPGKAPTQSLVQSDLKKFRQDWRVEPEEFLISSLGYVNRLKRVTSMLDAVVSLRKDGYPVKLLLAGKVLDESLDLDADINSRGLQGIVRVTGYLEDREFEACISSSDLILNLRYPSLGESSAALMTVLGGSKPCIVSDYNQFSELPGSVCWKVSPGELEVQELASLIRALLRDPALREQLGENGRRFVQDFASYERAAFRYAILLDQQVIT